MSGEFLIISGEGQAYGEDDADQWLRQTGWRMDDQSGFGWVECVFRGKSATDSGMKSATDSDLISAIPI